MHQWIHIQIVWSANGLQKMEQTGSIGQATRQLWIRLSTPGFNLKSSFTVRPDIEEVDGGVNNVREFLCEALEQTWLRIQANVMEDLVGRME